MDYDVNDDEFKHLRRNIKNTIFSLKSKKDLSIDDTELLVSLETILMNTDQDLKTRLTQYKNNLETKKERYIKDIIKPIDNKIDSIRAIMEAWN